MNYSPLKEKNKNYEIAENKWLDRLWETLDKICTDKIVNNDNWKEKYSISSN